jgi:phosphoribosylanthranilate isomerase
LDDVALAFSAGADAFGMIFAPSPQQIAWEEAQRIAEQLDLEITPVAVFVEPTRDEIRRVRSLFPNCVIQLSGNETPAFAKSISGTVIKALHVGNQSLSEMERLCDRYAPALVLFDTKVAGKFGGTGLSFDWRNIARLARWRPVFVAGGLTPQNVGKCVRIVRPFGVDVRSGIETKGRKDPGKMRTFVQAVRTHDAA